MKDTVYPLSRPISAQVIESRLKRYGKILHPIRDRRPLDPTKRLHVLLKDNIGLDGFTTPAGSYALRHLRIPDAFCVHKLKSANIDVFGKTHLRELAGFVTTQHATCGYSYLGGFSVNPHGDFPTGSSSSGSAVAVAAGFCDAALGTETNGSIMIPALRCGIWSIKPTRGLVSRTGIVPLSHTFDTPGVLARNVKTLETVLLAMAGADSMDRSSNIAPAILSESKTYVCHARRIGVLRFPKQKTDQEIEAAFDAFRSALQEKSIECVDIACESIGFDYKTIVSLDFVSDMDAFLGTHATDDVPNNFQELYGFYKSHPEVRPYGMDRLDDAYGMRKPTNAIYDALVETNIAKANMRIDTLLDEYSCDALLALRFVDWWAIGGAPSLAVPIGYKVSGEPIGVMIGGSRCKDIQLLSLGKLLEQVQIKRENLSIDSPGIENKIFQ